MKKKCTKCGIEKELNADNFYRRNNRKMKFRSDCIDCVLSESRKRTQRNKLKKKPIISKKTCFKCKQTKDVKEFHHNITTKDGYRTYCKECNLKVRLIKSKTLDGVIGDCIASGKRRTNLIYDINKEFLKNLYAKQNGLCVLSGIPLEFKQGNNNFRMNPYRLSVDRIDSSKGYIKNNIQLICAIINQMKTDMSQIEFIQICEKIYKHHKL